MNAVEKTEEEKVRELAATLLVDFMRWLSVVQLRLRCAEIVFTAGSAQQRDRLETHAKRLYDFAVDQAAVIAGVKKEA